MGDSADPDLKTVLAEFIDGALAKRSRLDLRWEDHDVTTQFLEALVSRGYTRTTVGDARVRPGERAPAFLVRDGTAYFGWIFWEKYSDRKLRKLFGSVIRNTKGDWAIQVTERMPELLFSNPDRIMQMDIDAPSGL